MIVAAKRLPAEPILELVSLTAPYEAAPSMGRHGWRNAARMLAQALDESMAALEQRLYRASNRGWIDFYAADEIACVCGRHLCELYPDYWLDATEVSA